VENDEHPACVVWVYIHIHTDMLPFPLKVWCLLKHITTSSALLSADVLRQVLPGALQSSGGKSTKTVKPEKPKSYRVQIWNFLEEHDKKG